MYFDIGFSWIFFLAQALLVYATFKGFELLPSSGPDGDPLTDMHCFMGLLFVKAICDESSFVHQALDTRLLLHGSRLLFQLWENSLAREMGSRYVDQVNVFVEKAFGVKSGKCPYTGLYISRSYCTTNIHSLLYCPSLTLSL